jgi:hypothetical protein
MGTSIRPRCVVVLPFERGKALLTRVLAQTLYEDVIRAKIIGHGDRLD